MNRTTSFLAALSLVAVIGCSKDEAKDHKNTAKTSPVAAQPAAAKVMKVTAQPSEAAQAKVGKVSAEQLEGFIKAGTVAVFDANSAKTRSEFGKIPTATLLSSSSDYALNELPADKAQKLVFYCSNTQCGASESSATKALAAGHSDVHVLPVGVIGWQKSGKTTERVL